MAGFDPVSLITGLGGLIGKGKGEAYYTGADLARQQGNQALASQDEQRQLIAALLKRAGYDVTYSAGNNPLFPEQKFQVPQPHITQNPNWNPLDDPAWKNTLATTQANDAALRRKEAPVFAGNRLGGVAQKGASAYNFDQQLAGQTNQAARAYAGNAQGNAQNLLMTALNTASAGAGQALPAANANLQAAQYGNQFDQQQSQNQMASIAQLGELLAAALDRNNGRSGGSDKLPSSPLPTGYPQASPSAYPMPDPFNPYGR